ncbi:DUF1971 domain-containing protein [Acinetobacter johnsonii]|uniref:DUF1971 domain-containing protein n=1 Tax=Acinetobacter johnsonii TaxID=40214 RepID=UPI00191A6E6C|nr:DUF1971 domain-containing protein [Acinetobacter johnsonii]QQT59196.1 DUF1971 domain-containing protein [Acinetobacter johnsonii]
MSHLVIPSHWKIRRSTRFFTKDNVPAALLSHHNTAEGVFGQICVMQGTVTFYGFANEAATEPEKVVIIKAGQFATSPPQYWHRVELSDDAQFNINFWADGDTGSQSMFKASTIHSKPIEKLFDQPTE